MPTTKKKIESFVVRFRTENGFSFAELVTCNEVVDRDLRVKQKLVTLKIMKENRKYIIGIVETSRDHNIPPKKHRKRKVISRLGLESDEGLAYANVFIYEKARSILMYEVNKSGCYVDHFIDYIYKCCKKSQKYIAFDIGLDPILNANEYRRFINLRFYKSLFIQLANPKRILEEFGHQNDALLNVVTSASDFGSARLKAKFEVAARGESKGLSPRRIQSAVNKVLEIFRGPQGDNVEKLEVVGYENDSDDGKLQPIDLIADRYLRHIELDEPRENSDLLEGQRQHQIKSLYEKSLQDFDEIFGSVEV